MHRLILLLCLLAFLPTTSQAKPLVADLSQYRIEIDSGFTGTRLLLFGSRNEIGDIVVVVRGPEKNFSVRKKGRILGMWINRQENKFRNIPDYYAIAASKPLADIRSGDLLKPLAIGLRDIIAPQAKSDDFTDALLKYQASRKLYVESPHKVSFMGESLFKLIIPFPDNIARGNYSADVYLFNDGALTSMQSIPLEVKKIGIDAIIYNVAHLHSLIYGFLCVIIALLLGWGASVALQKI
ncbi:MAG: TIGR02186 family protein [Pseudomonadota bacterium]